MARDFVEKNKKKKSIKNVLSRTDPLDELKYHKRIKICRINQAILTDANFVGKSVYAWEALALYDRSFYLTEFYE